MGLKPRLHLAIGRSSLIVPKIKKEQRKQKIQETLNVPAVSVWIDKWIQFLYHVDTQFVRKTPCSCNESIENVIFARNIFPVLINFILIRQHWLKAGFSIISTCICCITQSMIYILFSVSDFMTDIIYIVMNLSL